MSTAAVSTTGPALVLPDGLAGACWFDVSGSPDRQDVIRAAGMAIESLALGGASRGCVCDLEALVESASTIGLTAAVDAARRILSQPHVARAVDLLALQLDKVKMIEGPKLGPFIAHALAIEGDESDEDVYTASDVALHEAAHAITAWVLGARLKGVAVR